MEDTKYYCNFCEYKTNDRSCWHIHKKSVKHQKNSKKLVDINQNGQYDDHNDNDTSSKSPKIDELQCNGDNNITNNCDPNMKFNIEKPNIDFNNINDMLRVCRPNNKETHAISNHQEHGYNGIIGIIISQYESREKIMGELWAKILNEKDRNAKESIMREKELWAKMLDEKDKDIRKLNMKTEELLDQKDKNVKELLEQKDKSAKELLEQKDILINNLISINENLTDTNEHYVQLLSTFGDFAQKTVNALTFIMKNYVNAPPITIITNFDMVDIKGDFSRVNMQRHHDKIQYKVADLIISIHKKKDPKMQSFWCTDVDRLNYVIREQIADKTIASNKNKSTQQVTNKWIQDKKGLKLTEYIIGPMLEHVQNIAAGYLEQKHNEINNNMNKLTGVNAIKVNVAEIQQQSNFAVLISDIKNGTAARNVNKYIASHFYLNKNEV